MAVLFRPMNLRLKWKKRRRKSQASFIDYYSVEMTFASSSSLS